MTNNPSLVSHVLGGGVMADKPIIFSAPMVNALLAGRKTQTRRLVPKLFQDEESLTTCVNSKTGKLCYAGTNPQGVDWIWDVSPYLRYAPGDRLWAREAFIGPYAYEVNEYPPRDWGNKPIWFPADGPVPDKFAGQFWHRARPSIHMPRWASRLTLTVTDVRVQRLQEISAADSIAEGVQCGTCEFMNTSACNGRGCFASIAAFQALWNSLHGPDAWDANPWVAAYSFTVQRGNIDTQGGPQ